MQVNRRQILLGAAAASLPNSAPAVDFAKPVPEAEGLTAYKNGDQVIVRWNNRILTVYRAHRSMKYPYFSPVAGPVTGASLTSESALPYPHHRGLWLGCDPVNGGNYWADNALSTGHIRSGELNVAESTKTRVAITDRCEWVRGGAPSPIEDERRFTITAPSDKLWLIDARIKMTARQDVSIQKAKHSLFAIRTAPDLAPTYGGTLMNSEGGIGAKGTYGKVAKWCGYHAKRPGTNVTEGIAIFDHPENPWAPCPWFTRDYGHLSPSPFNFLDGPWRLARGKAIQMRYGVALHAGSPAEAKLDEVYNQWLAD